MSDPWRFFCLVSTHNGVALLTTNELAQVALDALQDTVEKHNGQLWGYVILPASVQFVIEVTSERAYHHYVEAFKAASEQALIEAIQAGYEVLLDAITFYNPAWPQPVHHIWQSGYQTQLLPSAYALSNKVADLVQRPVEMGLVKQPADWAFSSYQVDNT